MFLISVNSLKKTLIHESARNLPRYFFFNLQIKQLLQQQNAPPLPTSNPLLTPPKTPHSECSHGNGRSPDHSRISMVTACTNTGASLLLGSPVKPSGKRSAATSPMKVKEMNHSKGFVESLPQQLNLLIIDWLTN